MKEPTIDEMKASLMRRFGFAADEIKTLFPTDEQVKEAYEAALATVSEDDEEEEWDVSIDVKLTDEQKLQAKKNEALKKLKAKNKAKHAKAVVDAKAQKAKKEDDELKSVDVKQAVIGSNPDKSRKDFEDLQQQLPKDARVSWDDLQRSLENL